MTPDEIPPTVRLMFNRIGGQDQSKLAMLLAEYERVRLAGVKDMADRLEGSIFDQGWCAEVDAALTALQWAASDNPIIVASMASRLERYLATPADQRREEWIRAGGNPANWSEKLVDNPTSTG